MPDSLPTQSSSADIFMGFRASRHGDCSLCAESYWPGVQIVYLGKHDGGWVHADCACDAGRDVYRRSATPIDQDDARLTEAANELGHPQ